MCVDVSVTYLHGYACDGGTGELEVLHGQLHHLGGDEPPRLTDMNLTPQVGRDLNSVAHRCAKLILSLLSVDL